MTEPRRRRSALARARGIRARIVAGYVILLALTLAVAVLLTRQLLYDRFDGEIDGRLEQEIEELRQLTGGINPATGEGFGGDVRAIFELFLQRNVPDDDEAFYTVIDGVPGPYSFEAPTEPLGDAAIVERWARTTGPTWRELETAAGTARTLSVPIRVGSDVAGVFVVAYFVENDRAGVERAVRTIALVGLGVLVVSAVVAWSLAGRVLRPVRELTATARTISDSDLTARIPVEGNDELAELGRTFNEMVARVETGVRSQRRFLDDVVHDLRTPITIARGHLEMFGDDPEERAASVDIVIDELDRMSRYVSDLLVLAKAGQPDFLRMTPIDLGELAQNLWQKAIALAPRTWVLDAAPPPGRVAIVADVDRLNQAVFNLVANAVQHTAEGDEIGLDIAAIDGNVRISVRDTGSGVDPAIVDRLFSRFERGDDSRAARPDGMGIGLSIVHAIVDAHGGTASVDTRPGCGATFTITIPTEPHPPEDIA